MHSNYPVHPHTNHDETPYKAEILCCYFPDDRKLLAGLSRCAWESTLPHPYDGRMLSQRQGGVPGCAAVGAQVDGNVFRHKVFRMPLAQRNAGVSGVKCAAGRTILLPG